MTKTGVIMLSLAFFLLMNSTAALADVCCQMTSLTSLMKQCKAKCTQDTIQLCIKACEPAEAIYKPYTTVKYDDCDYCYWRRQSCSNEFAKLISQTSPDESPEAEMLQGAYILYKEKGCWRSN